MADLSDLVVGWPGEHSLVVADGVRILGGAGNLEQPRRIASITKLFTSWAVLIATEERTLALDDPAGPDGSTVRHLLAHTSGLAFEGDAVLAAPGTRRIYSNTGIEVLADTLAAAAAMPFEEYLALGVLEPLGLGHLRLAGSPAHGLHASALDLVTFGRELLTPKLIAPATAQLAVTAAWPELSGVLPGFGMQRPNPWGLGFEIRGTKDPHWTAPGHSPDTFGHFGGAGSFLWVDPTLGLIGATVGSEGFGDWAAAAWAPTNQAILDRFGSAGPRPESADHGPSAGWR